MRYNLQDRNPEEQQIAEKRLLQRQSKKARKLAEAGIDYDISAVGYVSLPCRHVLQLKLMNVYRKKRPMNEIDTHLVSHVVN